jgi:hypothetical protein
MQADRRERPRIDAAGSPQSGATSDPRPRCAATLGPVAASFGAVHGPGEAAPTAADVQAAVERLAAIGLRGVQWPGTTPTLRPRDLDGGARRGVRSVLDRLELVFTGIDLWIAPAHYLDRERIDRAVGAVDLAKVANVERKLPRDFITPDGFGITEKCRRYLLPLIGGGDPPPYKDGLPVYVKLRGAKVRKRLPPFKA